MLLFALFWLPWRAICDACGARKEVFSGKWRPSKGAVYMLGSIHLLKSDNATLKPIIDETFKKSNDWSSKSI